MSVTDKAYLKTAWKAVDDKFGADTIVLDIKNISPMADYFMITTGSNPNQVKALAQEITENLSKAGLTLNHSEGTNSLNWVLLDFGLIIVHIFDKESREFYNLERIWGDAVKIHPEQLD